MKFKSVFKANTISKILSSAVLVCTILVFTSGIPAKDELAEDVFKYTNQFRRSNGKSTLEMRDDLNAIARAHSEDMAAGRRSFGHGGYDQRVLKVKRLVKPCNGSIGENVAYGARTAKDAMSIWKNSSGHRKNMLGNYKYIGVGTARSKRGITYYTQIFVR